MGAEEQNQEQQPAFVFKESGAIETNNSLEYDDVVQIPDGQSDDSQQTTEEQNTDGSENQENSSAEDSSSENNDSGQETEDDDTVYDLDENLSFTFLKEKYGLESDSFEEFLKSKEAKKIDPEIEKFQEFKAKTGRGYNDFLQTQKDWSKETPEVIIKATLKIENPDLSDEDIDFLFDKDYGFDEDIDDEFDVKSKKISLKVDSRKALAALEKQKEDYAVPRGSDDDNIPEDYRNAKDAIEKLYDEQVENEEISKTLRNDFLSQTNSVLHDNFEGFKFIADGQEFKIKPKDIKQARENQSDIGNFQKKFFNKENKMSDALGYHKSLFAGMDPDEFFNIAFNLGKTTYAEKLEKESKNIDVKGDKHIPEPALSNFTFKKVS